MKGSRRKVGLLSVFIIIKGIVCLSSGKKICAVVGLL